MNVKTTATERCPLARVQRAVEAASHRSKFNGGKG
jgi:hypothetical protein